MTIVDAQVHAYERHHPGRPWVDTITGPAEVTGDDMVAAMDEVGVGFAILVSPFALYRYDGSYLQVVHSRYPDRFRLIKPVDVADPDVGRVIADWSHTPGSIGIRVLLAGDTSDDAADPRLGRALAAAERSGVPVNVAGPGRLLQIGQLAARHPSVQLIVDHLGLHQPFTPPVSTQAFADLPQLLQLAAHDNVAVKLTGVCTLAHEPFPFPDIWDPLETVLEQFGVDRCMWGSDWTRTGDFATYKQAVDAFATTDRLSDSDRRALFGTTLRRIYEWPADPSG